LQALSEHARIVRLPLNHIYSYTKILKAFTKLEQHYQREPTIDEIGEMTNLHPSQVDQELNASGFHVSLDAPLFEDEGAEYNLYDVMKINDLPAPDHSLIHDSLKHDIERVMESLSDREAEIIIYYFGLKGIRAHSLEEIGKKLDITRERVRQIKENALMKLQYTRRKSLLNSYQ